MRFPQRGQENRKIMWAWAAWPAGACDEQRSWSWASLLNFHQSLIKVSSLSWKRSLGGFPSFDEVLSPSLLLNNSGEEGPSLWLSVLEREHGQGSAGPRSCNASAQQHPTVHPLKHNAGFAKASGSWPRTPWELGASLWEGLLRNKPDLAVSFFQKGFERILELPLIILHLQGEFQKSNAMKRGVKYYHWYSNEG